MRVDMRAHTAIREQVHAGLAALLVQARHIWGADTRHTLLEIVIRLMVGVGDLARLARDGYPQSSDAQALHDEGGLFERDLKKEFGNVLLSTIRWVDDLGLDVLECLDLAIEAQEKFVQSGRTR